MYIYNIISCDLNAFDLYNFLQTNDYIHTNTPIQTHKYIINNRQILIGRARKAAVASNV